ncbi:hypothetical protein AB833_13680 [Chromatiales bacterium (ex Bugula neritina AB1)]|nr:hypothetical protein AB833_13680 [Chromatiales bacterium (ex Bugula neritina AB1)]
MSSFLQPDGKPFYGGTYYPPAAFANLLGQIAGVWAEDPVKIAEFASQVSDAIDQSHQLGGQAHQVGEREIAQARAELLTTFDNLQGGFGPAPKFMREPALFFLLELAQRNSDVAALDAANFTLQRISAGGIHDHIAGGFHRYAVDHDWLVPHFEKMLYNQAAMARILLQAAHLTGEPEHERSARRLLDYVLREMTNENGGFYSATDADSEGEEGTFFVWTPAEITEVLGSDDAKLAFEVWGVTEEGNFESANILHLRGPIAEVAEDYGLNAEQLTRKLDSFSEKLLAVRNTREPPLTDTKVITEWNGMMITALAVAGDTLNEPRYIIAAKKAAGFIWEHNHRENGELWRAYFDGRSSIDASQADYAYMAQAMLALHDVTSEPVWMERTVAMVDTMNQLFWDTQDGGYFIGAESVAGALLPARPKDLHDNASPTGNSVALQLLARLWFRTGEEKYRQRAQQLLTAFSSNLAQGPSAFSYLLVGASELLYGETGARQYAARGKVKIEAAATSTKLTVRIDIAPGWHINAAEPLQDYLINTNLALAGDAAAIAVQYPDPELRVLGFQRAELALYEGEIALQASLPAGIPARPMRGLELQLQACSDEICLAPETVVLNVPVR